MGPWFVRPAILAAAVLVLIFPKALRQWQVWGALAVLTAIRIVDDWPLADNHIYLLGYWLLAVSLALRSRDAASTLADASRALIGLAFAFAVVWKVALSPDFLDGRFFRVTLVTDPRFAAATQIDRRPVRRPAQGRTRSGRAAAAWRGAARIHRRWSSRRGCGCSRWPPPGARW